MKRLDANEIFALLGLGSLALGLAMVYLPAAFIAVGVLLLAYSVIPGTSPAPEVPVK